MRHVPENIDPLEAELRSFRPVEPSRELFDRVGRQLASDRARPVWPWLAGAVAAAACIVVATFVWRTSHRPLPNLVQVPSPAPTVAAVAGDDRPALASYRRRLAELLLQGTVGAGIVAAAVWPFARHYHVLAAGSPAEAAALFVDSNPSQETPCAPGPPFPY